MDLAQESETININQGGNPFAATQQFAPNQSFNIQNNNGEQESVDEENVGTGSLTIEEGCDVVEEMAPLVTP